MPTTEVNNISYTYTTSTTGTNLNDCLTKPPSVSDTTLIDPIIVDNVTHTIIEHPYCYRSLSSSREATFTMTVPEFHPEWNCKPDDLSYYNPMILYGRSDPVIVNIDVIVPDKVVGVTIFDGKKYVFKQICKEPDEFSLEFALALALVKYENKRQLEQGIHETLTLEGIEAVAHEYLWKYNEILKEIRRAIKAYKKWAKEEAQKEAEEVERQAIIKRRRAKNKKRRERMLAKKKEDEINTIAEAIKRSRE